MPTATVRWPARVLLVLVLLVSTTWSGAAQSPAAPGALPTAREATAAVWDGTHAYVFGGLTPDGETDEIVRFDPVTGETVVMNATLPTPRRGVSAVWTGSEALLFGGYEAPGMSYDDILRYDVASDTITMLNATLPSGRDGTSAVWTGREAIIFGGSPGQWPYLKDILRYDPALDTLTAASARLPAGGHHGSAFWDGTYAYFIGGHDGYGGWQDAIVRYDPQADHVEVVGHLPAPGEMDAVWAGDVAYFVGGSIDGGFSDEVLRYQPRTLILDGTGTSLASPRGATSAVWTGDLIIVFGGRDASQQFADILRVDVATRVNKPPVFAKLVPGEDYEVNERWANVTVFDDRNVTSVTLHLQINDGAYEALPLTFDHGTDMWSVKLPLLNRGDTLRLYFTAQDDEAATGFWGKSDAPAASFAIGNRPPVVDVLEPSPGSTISGNMTIAWRVSDPDGDPQDVRVFLRASGAPEWESIGRSNASEGRLSVDTTAWPDGEYEVEVSSYDGAFYATGSFHVTIRNDRLEPPIGDIVVTPSDPKEGDQVVVSAMITRSDVIRADVVITREGAHVGKFPLRDDGQDGDAAAGDGRYAARFDTDGSGEHHAEVVVEYREEGVVKRHREHVPISIAAASIDIGDRDADESGLDEANDSNTSNTTTGTPEEPVVIPLHPLVAPLATLAGLLYRRRRT